MLRDDLKGAGIPAVVEEPDSPHGGTPMSLLPLQVAVLCAAVGAEPADATAHPRTVYFTTGDHQDLLGLPLDSNATVEAAFEAIRKLYHVRRVWWRGGQEEVWGKEFIIRPENRIFDRTW